jgi:hypothetical protein
VNHHRQIGASIPREIFHDDPDEARPMTRVSCREIASLCIISVISDKLASCAGISSEVAANLPHHCGEPFDKRAYLRVLFDLMLIVLAEEPHQAAYKNARSGVPRTKLPIGSGLR